MTSPKKATKRRKGQSASKARLGGFTSWMLYDAADTYTGSSLWETKRVAEAERKFEDDIGSMPRDGKWRIRKVHVRFA